MKIIKDVRQFMERVAGIEYRGGPRMLPKRLAAQRVEHLHEELEEYEHALSPATAPPRALEDALDALVDLVYVAVGNAYLHGFPFEAAWDRVHAANMTKRGVGVDAAEKQGVVKPNDWQPPHLTDLVMTHLNVDRVTDIDTPTRRLVDCRCGLCECEVIGTMTTGRVS